jgi:hypothetical protein
VRPMVRQTQQYIAQRDESEARLRAREKVTRALYDITSTTQMDHLQKVQALLAMGCDYFRMTTGMLTGSTVKNWRSLQRINLLSTWRPVSALREPTVTAPPFWNPARRLASTTPDHLPGAIIAATRFSAWKHTSAHRCGCGA